MNVDSVKAAVCNQVSESSINGLLALYLAHALELFTDNLDRDVVTICFNINLSTFNMIKDPFFYVF